MGCSKDTLSVYVETDVIDTVETYRENRDIEKHEALKELVQTGYREQRSPLLYRAKQQSKDVAFYLPLVAATVAIIGQLASVLPVTTGYQIAVVLCILALTPLAAVETVRRARDVLAETEVLQ